MLAMCEKPQIPMKLWPLLIHNGDCKSAEYRKGSDGSLLVTAVKEINGIPQQVTISLGNYEQVCRSPQKDAICACAYWSIMNGFRRMAAA